MSCDYDSYALTDDERSAGIGSLLCGNYEEETYEPILTTRQQEITDDLDKKTYKPVLTTRQQELIKVIADLDKTIKIKKKSIKKILFDGINVAINIYVKEENLSSQFLNIARQNDGLTILLKGFLNKKCYFKIDEHLSADIYYFVKSIYKDKKNDLVYNRVAKVQKFIHHKVQKKYGGSSHLMLDKLAMRNVLSTTRLHLEIRNIKDENIDSLIALRNKTRQFQFSEKKHPTRVKLLKNQKYVPYWRIEHLKSLIDYLPTLYIREIDSIIEIPITESVDDYKEAIISKIH